MRDFRDAKAMAGALRKALAADQITVTNSQSLELIARVFGLADWNTLSAKIGAAQTPQPAPADPTLHCSFCGKSQHVVETLVAGPDVRICNECIGLCDGILIDNRLGKLIAEARSRDPAADPVATAVDALGAYSDDQLTALRSGAAGWLDHMAWSLDQIKSRLAADQIRPWRLDEAAQRRGWTRDPLAGKTREQIEVQRAELQRRQRDVSERLRLVDDILAARGLG